MNMDKFDMDIWYLHRKLFHRFVKYAKYFRQATEALPEYVKALKQEKDEHETKQRALESQVPEVAIICLLTSSSDDVSDDDDVTEDEQEKKEVEPHVSDDGAHM